MKTLTSMLTILLLIVAAPALAETITLTWDAPTENTDNTPYTDPAGFKIYRHDAGDVFTEVADIPHTQTTTERTDVGIGTYCYVVTAYNSKGRESERSNEACVSLTQPKTIELRITIE